MEKKEYIDPALRILPVTIECNIMSDHEGYGEDMIWDETGEW